MKQKSMCGFLGIFLALSFVQEIQASEYGRFKSRRPAEEAPVASSSYEYALGFTTFTLPGSVGSPASFSGMVQLNEKQWIQAHIFFPSTSPLTIGFGGIFKQTVSGDKDVGFHLGGGMALGTVQALTFSVMGVAGFHFTIPGLHKVSLHVDGGPAFSFVNTPLASTSSFGVGFLSANLGLSAVYWF